MALNRGSEAIETGSGQRLIGGIQDDHKLFTAKTEQPVTATEGLAHEFAHPQQNFVAEQVAEGVIDALEVINVDYTKPSGRLFVEMIAPLIESIVRIVSTSAGQQAIKGFIKGFAIEQTREGIELAIVEQPELVTVNSR